MHKYLCSMHVKSLSKPKSVGEKREIPSCLCHWLEKLLMSLSLSLESVWQEPTLTIHSPAWRTWAGEAWGCAVTFLGCHPIPSRFWPRKPGFCYSEFLSVQLNIPSSSQQLSSGDSMSCTYLSCDFLDIFDTFLLSVFQTQFIPVGSVCWNTNEKTELLSDVGLMMVQVTVFLTSEKCLGVVCCFLLHCFCDMWRGLCQMTRPPQDFVWCFPFDISEKSWFVSWLMSKILNN